MVELFYEIFKKHKHKFLNVLKPNHTIILSRGKIILNFVPEFMPYPLKWYLSKIDL
jgi:hypothetical protein